MPWLKRKRDLGGPEVTKKIGSEGTAPPPPHTHAPRHAQVPASHTHPLTGTSTCLNHPPNAHKLPLTHFFPHSQCEPTRPLTALTLTPGTHASIHLPVGACRVPGVGHANPLLTSKRADTHSRPCPCSVTHVPARPSPSTQACPPAIVPLRPPGSLPPDVQVPGRLRAPTPTLAVHTDGL